MSDLGVGSGIRAVAILTHAYPEETREALREVLRQAREAGVELYFDPEETRKFGLSEEPGIRVDVAPAEQPVQLCLVLGGDGTILRALSRFAGSDVPVFAVNFGTIGFLATVEPEDLAEGVGRALQGEFELLRLPAIALTDELDKGIPGAPKAINDVAIHRRMGDRVAELAYSVNGLEIGNVRCDGLVLATPAGSTGYNLANAGPVMAWGVEGFVVSFIAPHSLTARALVVAPADRLTVENRSRTAVEVSVDGQAVWELPAGGSVHAGFHPRVGAIAQLPGSSFYLRLREKFGRLAR